MEIINLPPVPFYIIAIDFILSLLLIKNSEDYIISVTCKFFKILTLITRKTTFRVRK